MSKYGSIKPMCMGCMRRCYGMDKEGGWWCTNCDSWVDKPKKVKRGK